MTAPHMRWAAPVQRVALGALFTVLLGACAASNATGGDGAGPPHSAEPAVASPSPASPGAAPAAPPDAVPDGLRCLKQAYPDSVCSVEANALVLCDGTRFVYDDGRDKSAEERLREPDLEDQMAQRLAPGPATGAPPPAGHDPGRVRHQPFFEAMYGADREAVEARLTEVIWMFGESDRRLRVSRVHGVHERLAAVSDALMQLAPEVVVLAADTAGAYQFRNVRGTDRRSAHSFGIAIDIASQRADYWRWRKGADGAPLPYRNRVPLEIVEAFEREGFLWGGRWHHYDTMHFEYRPELLLAECRAAVPPGPEVEAAQPPRPRPVYAWGPAVLVGEDLRTRFAPPPGFERRPVEPGSFAHWLRHLPLRPGRGTVMLHDGRTKGLQDAHSAVIDIDVGRRDLQQCADAVMRMRAEFLFASDRGDEICFRAVSGKPLPYRRWRRGERPPRGRAHPWTHQAARDGSHIGFRRFMDRVFGIANTASLRREMLTVTAPLEVEAGDVYIQGASGGFFGHAVLVLDVAENAAGERRFLIAQSYMPAQDFHVLRNTAEPALGSWYRPTVDGGLRTPEWNFPAGSLRRFGKSCR